VIQPADADADHAELTAELSAWLAGQLSPVKRPRSWFYRPELPRLPTGKLLKRVLVEELVNKDAPAPGAGG